MERIKLKRGYVRTKEREDEETAPEHGSIHVNFALIEKEGDVFNSCPLALARTIVHEATHATLDTEDHAYRYDPAYNTLTPVEAFNNADSLAWAMTSLAVSRLLTDEDTTRAAPQVLT